MEQYYVNVEPEARKVQEEEQESVKPSTVFDEFEVSGSIASHPIIYDGIIYFGSCDTYFYALDAKTGKLLWKFKTGGLITANPVIYKNNIYFGSFDGYFYALDAKNGNLLWKFLTGDRIFATAAVVDEKVYFGSFDRHLYALSIDGKLLWKFVTGDAIACSPVVINDVVYFGCFDKCLYAVKNGVKLWNFFAGGPIGSPIVVGDSNGNELFSIKTRTNKISINDATIFFGSWDQNLYAMSLDGKLKWKFPTGGAVIANPAIFNKSIYFFSNDHNLYCISYDGKLKWKFLTGEACGYMYPLIHKGMIYFGSCDKNLYALDMNGNMKWRFLTGGEVWSSPCVYNDVLYFGSFDTHLYAILLKNKKVLWRFQTGMASQLKSRKIFDILGKAEKLTKLKSMLMFWKRETKKSEYEKSNKEEGQTNQFFYTPVATYKHETTYVSQHPYMMRKDKR